jgi:AraC family transcriptional regulator of adaptative response / DNA-3-methyladenine glycosylase II
VTDLDAAICYRAILARDARFDGKFFTGVASTGIYCRPVCPARTPARRNCRFFPSAAAAQEAGFRPCLRCRPEIAPGLPAYNGTGAVVARALRLIDEGGLDGDSVESLAGRLGIGDRHLRRLFLEQVGASPVAVAQNRRILFAKQLLTDTRLPVTAICFSSGFASVRRFNDTMLRALGRAPRDFRRLAGPRARGGIELKLAYRPPFDWDGLLAFFAPRAIPGVERVEDGVYSRTIRAGETTGFVSVENRAAGNCLVARLDLSSTRDLAAIVQRLRAMFDLACDPHEIHARLSRDRLFRGARPGVRLPGGWDAFELGVRAILGQQISVAAATTLAGRLAAAFGDRCPHGVLFPAPERLAAADLRSIGLPESRAASIRALAASEALQSDAPAAEESIAALAALPGVGPWTAEYLAMRALRHPDAFPSGDLALRRASGGLTARELKRRAEAWRPWRAYAALYLWRMYATRN